MVAFARLRENKRVLRNSCSAFPVREQKKRYARKQLVRFAEI